MGAPDLTSSPVATTGSTKEDQMEFLYAALPFVACGAMALVCGRMMMHRPKADGESPNRDELADLRSEVAALRAERGRPADTHP